VDLERLIPDDYTRLENDDLELSEGRIRRIFREEMSDEQTLDGDVPHVMNTVLSQLLSQVVDLTLDEADMMARVKEAHLRKALREVEIEEQFNTRTEMFVEQLKDISEQMEKTAEKIDSEN
jgi:uncharacterized protein involved in exopolysaccharide biosynthesis